MLHHIRTRLMSGLQLLALLLACMVVTQVLWLRHVQAQIAAPGAILQQLAPAYNAVVPISATAAASTQTTLTIPAPPPGLYNYLCSLHFNASHDNTTTTALTNGVTTSTNFGGYAIKLSLQNATANGVYDWVDNWSSAPGSGCVKSVSPGTATTFVSPTGTANMQFTWTATYFQAP